LNEATIILVFTRQQLSSMNIAIQPYAIKICPTVNVKGKPQVSAQRSDSCKGSKDIRINTTQLRELPLPCKGDPQRKL